MFSKDKAPAVFDKSYEPNAGVYNPEHEKGMGNCVDNVRKLLRKFEAEGVSLEGMQACLFWYEMHPLEPHFLKVDASLLRPEEKKSSWVEHAVVLGKKNEVYDLSAEKSLRGKNFQEYIKQLLSWELDVNRSEALQRVVFQFFPAKDFLALSEVDRYELQQKYPHIPLSEILKS